MLQYSFVHVLYMAVMFVECKNDYLCVSMSVCLCVVVCDSCQLAYLLLFLSIHIHFVLFIESNMYKYVTLP